MAARRTLRILLRRPFDELSSVLRLRRGKRRILALRRIRDSYEGLTSRRVRPACMLLGHQHGCATPNGLLKWHSNDRPALEQTGRLGCTASGDPGFVCPSRAGIRKVSHDERRISCLGHDKSKGSTGVGDGPGVIAGEERGDALLPRERVVASVELP